MWWQRTDPNAVADGDANTNTNDYVNTDGAANDDAATNRHCARVADAHRDAFLWYLCA